MLIGARNVVYNLSLADLTENYDQVRIVFVIIIVTAAVIIIISNCWLLRKNRFSASTP